MTTVNRPLAETMVPVNPGTPAPARVARTKGKGKNTPRHQALVNLGTRRRIGRMGGAAKVMPAPSANLSRNLVAPAPMGANAASDNDADDRRY